MSLGLIIAIASAAFTAIIAGLGSAIGVQMAGNASAGVVSEKPELFGKLLLLQILPGTQGIYGFLAAFLVLVQVKLIGGPAIQISTQTGWAYFGACMPAALNGFLTAILQAKVAVSAIHLTAKQPDASAKGMTMTAMVETYAILSLLASILLIFGINPAL